MIMATTRLIRTVIMGPPGAGKGTISSRLVRVFDLKHLSSGDLLRWHINQGTTLGVEAKQSIEEGKLVSDHTMQELILSELAQLTKRGWLLDGFPRTLPQVAALLEQELVHAVINLNVPFETIIDRVKGRWIHPDSGRVYNEGYNPPKQVGLDDITGERLVQRPDDHPDAVQERLRQYEQQTKPVMDYFRGKGLLVTFTGTESDKLWPQVKDYVEQYIPLMKQ